MKPRNRMMHLLALPAIAGLGALAACQTTPSDPSASVVNTRDAMVDGINPAAITIWDITNAAMDDTGEFNFAQVDNAGWARLGNAAQLMERYSNAMASAEQLQAGGPQLADGEIPPGVATREEIQDMIDSDTAGYRAMSQVMAGQAAALAAAAQAQDGQAVGELVGRMDAACQTCHVRYWYKQ